MRPARTLVSAGIVLTMLGITTPATPAPLTPAPTDQERTSAASVAKPGPLGMRRFRVDLGNTVEIGAPARAEFRSEVTVPVGSTGSYPLAVFLHGAHPTCFRSKGNDDGWPCARNFRPIPSFAGYRYLADRLASQGVASVSISANGVNGQEQAFADGGTGARAVLVRRHLTAISSAATGTGSAYPQRFARQVDLDRVMVVGHSRGSSAVVRAAIKAGSSSLPYRIVAAVTLAGTTQVKQAAPGLPLLALIPQCDGDVIDLESQLLVDEGARLPGDTAMRTAVWIPGGNHNFLNTQWTPGLSIAKSWNDAAVLDKWDGPCHRGKRISSGAERRVARAYIEVMAAVHLLGDTAQVRFIDGSHRRPPGVGDVRTRATATQGGAVLLERRWRGRVLSRRVKAQATRALPSAQRAGWTDVQTPHWLPALEFPGPSTRQRALLVRWNRPGLALARLGSTADLTNADRVQLRVATDNTNWRRGRVSLALRDAGGRTARIHVPRPQLVRLGRGLPQSLWAQSVSLPVARVRRQAPRLDLSRVRWIGLAARAGSGRLWVLDAWATRPGPPPPPTAARVATIAASGSATWSSGRYRVRLLVSSGSVAPKATTVRFALYPYEVGTWKTRGTITLPAGERQVSRTVTVRGRKRDSRLIVATYPERWGVNLTDYVWLPVR